MVYTSDTHDSWAGLGCIALVICVVDDAGWVCPWTMGHDKDGWSNRPNPNPSHGCRQH